MSDDEMRIAFAEARGWTGCYATDSYVTGIDPHGIERDLPKYTKRRALTKLNMTAHEFARKLLDGPDLPIVVPKVVEYSDNEEDNCRPSAVSETDGIDHTEQPMRILIIT